MAAESPDLIARRAHSVRSVKQVLEALWAVARAQKPQADQLVAQSTLYLDWLDQVVDHVAGPVAGQQTDWLTVVLGPERSFCGALPRRVLAQLNHRGPTIVVGTRLAEVLDEHRGNRRIEPVATVQGASSTGELEAAAERTTIAIVQHVAGRGVELLYPRASESSLHRAVILAGDREPRATNYDLLSSEATVLRHLVSESLSGRVFVGLAETLRLELSTRLMTLEAARNNADDKLKELAEAWQLARQERITNELSELVAARLAT